jgi:hypothetical protein
VVILNAREIWNYLLKRVNESEFEIHTVPKNRRKPRWFVVIGKDESIIIQEAKINRPSVELSTERKLTFKDFEFVYSYYDRWLTGEVGVRQEVTRSSRNTAYILALIADSRKEKR